MKIQLKLAVLTAALTSAAFAQSAVVRYELTIAEKTQPVHLRHGFNVRRHDTQCAIVEGGRGQKRIH